MDTYTERQLFKLLDEHVKDLKSLAGGWQVAALKFADNPAYARGLGICAQQLYETIARLETLIEDEREAGEADPDA